MLILGWAYSQPEHVSKYTDLHNALGYDTLTYTSYGKLLFANRQPQQRQVAKQIVETIRKTGHKRVVAHTLSNNGFNMLGHVHRVMEIEGQLELAGAILDSGPQPFKFHSYFFVNQYGRFAVDSKTNMMFAPVAFFYILYFTQGNY